MEDRQSQIGLTKTQKTGFVLLLIFGILTIFLAGLQLRNNIYGPFAAKMAAARAVQNVQLDEQTRLQMIDTDQDGLTDWEEINFYSTSPYLPDTDSDGVSDKIEIDKGTNPLCPEGQQCDLDEGLISATSTPTSTYLSPLLNEANVLEQIGMTTGTEQPDFSSLSAMLGDKQKLRQMLLQTGSITEDQLSKIDDKTLDAMINEVLLQQSATGNSSNQLNSSTTIKN